MSKFERRPDDYEQPERTEDEMRADYEEYMEHARLEPDEDGPDYEFVLNRFIHTPTECWTSPRPHDFVPGLAFERSVGVIVSEPHVGKTLMLLDLAVAMSTGQTWIGWQPRHAVPALVYALDSPAWESCEQARNLMAGRGIDPRITTPMFAIACREQTKSEFGRFDIMNARCYQHVVECAQGLGAKLIGFDSLSKLHTKDENDRASMEEVMGQLELLATKTGAHIMVMHHTPVGGRMGRTTYAGRGSSVIAASIDLELHLWKRKDGRRVMDVLKARGSDIADQRFTLALERVQHPEVPRAVRWAVVDDVPAGRPSGRTPKIEEVRTTVLDALAQPRSRNDLQNLLVARGLVELESAYNMVNSTLTALKAEGKVLSRQRGTWEQRRLASHEAAHKG